MMKCPKCGSEHVVPIIYGITRYNEEQKRLISNEKAYPARSREKKDRPEYHCFECGKDIGSPPIIVSNQGIVDYRDIVTSIRLYKRAVRDFEPTIISISKNVDSINLQVKTPFDEGLPIDREMSEMEWRDLLNLLYNKAYLHEWKRQYTDPDWYVIEGVNWELTVKLKERRIRKYTSGNIDPPYWQELDEAFRPFLREARDMLIQQLEKEMSDPHISKEGEETLKELIEELMERT